MSEPAPLLTVKETAAFFKVSVKSIRRWIQRGDLVAHRVGHNVRVDGLTVTRLLAGSSNRSRSALDAHMKKDEENKAANGADQPHLLRQKPRTRVWTAWIDFKEVPLGTTDREEAEQRLAALVNRRKAPHPELTHAAAGAKRRPYRVYREQGRFVIKYYDAAGVRRKHWIPRNLAVPIVTDEEAEAYAAKWYRGELGDTPAAPSMMSGVGAGLIRSNMTLRQFGLLWTTGELAKRFPDHVKEKRSSKDDAGRLSSWVYPVIGDEPLRSFEGRRGLELAERVVAALPPVGPTFRPASRRQVLQALHRLLVMAVYPAKVLTENPLPRGFVPKTQSNKAKTYLYPEEDAKLMRCVSVPLRERLFFGILAREGMRVSELLELRWRDVDLERGVLTLDKNKSNEPRAWAMDPGVVAALKRWKARHAPKATPSQLITADRQGRALDRYEVAERLRSYLAEAGIKRPQLFESSDTRIPLRAHDLRASFVTVNLASGRSEAWITDRTGHRSSQMIYRYKRAARTHAELELGTFEALHEAIPELAALEKQGS